MQIYPAIEIKNGQCAKIKSGLFDQVIPYSDSPVDMAVHWMNEGGTFIHLSDLDGAIAGHSVNAGVFKKIAYEIPVPLQLGGGIRTLQEIEFILNCGISRVVIGGIAVQNPGFVKEAIKLFSSKKIVVNINLKDNRVVSRHGTYRSGYSPTDFCKKMEDMGVKTVIVRHISSSFLEKLNLDFPETITRKTNMDVIVKGGINSLKDLEYVNQAGIHGVIIGKALTERKIELRTAVKLFQKKREY